jgi:hypothetical protein
MFCFLVMQKCVKTTSGSGLQILHLLGNWGWYWSPNLATFRKLGMVLVSKAVIVWKLGMVPSLNFFSMSKLKMVSS